MKVNGASSQILLIFRQFVTRLATDRWTVVLEPAERYVEIRHKFQCLR